MPDKRISEYTVSVIRLLNDNDLIDVSVRISVGPDVFRSDKSRYEEVKSSDDLLYFLDVASPSVGITAMDLNFLGKKVLPSKISFFFEGGQTGQPMQVKVQKGSGDGDIVPLIFPVNITSLGGTYVYHIGGAGLQLLESDIVNFEIISLNGPSAPFMVEISGAHKTV